MASRRSTLRCASCRATYWSDDAHRCAPKAPEQPTTHDLKIWPEPFAAIVDGSKRFEIRKDDRGFTVGDVLRLREWAPVAEVYSGRVQTRTVCYIARGWGLPDDMVVMGLDDGPPEFEP